MQTLGLLSMLTITAAAWTQPVPPPPAHDARSVERRIEEMARRFDASSPANAEQKELMGFAHAFLEQASRAASAGRVFQADRLADAADACRRPAEHLQPAPGGGRRGPPAPPGKEDRLRQVYFRLRVSDFYLQQIPAPKPERLLTLARGFYERAVKAKESGNAQETEEYTASADDLTHALESLAQAYTDDGGKLP